MMNNMRTIMTLHPGTKTVIFTSPPWGVLRGMGHDVELTLAEVEVTTIVLLTVTYVLV
jgi:hypothetical protein